MATLTRSETGNQAPDTGIRLEPRDSVLLTKDRFPAPSEAISAEEAATRLGICVRSVHKLIRRGVLPATQLMRWAGGLALPDTALHRDCRARAERWRRPILAGAGGR